MFGQRARQTPNVDRDVAARDGPRRRTTTELGVVAPGASRLVWSCHWRDFLRDLRRRGARCCHTFHRDLNTMSCGQALIRFETSGLWRHLTSGCRELVRIVGRQASSAPLAVRPDFSSALARLASAAGSGEISELLGHHPRPAVVLRRGEPRLALSGRWVRFHKYSGGLGPRDPMRPGSHVMRRGGVTSVESAARRPKRQPSVLRAWTGLSRCRFGRIRLAPFNLVPGSACCLSVSRNQRTCSAGCWGRSLSGPWAADSGAINRGRR